MRQFRCPYCGGNELQGRCCAYCDSIILEEDPKETQQVPAKQEQPPAISVYREYEACNCTLTLEQDAFVIRNYLIGKKAELNKTRIPYDEIRALYFLRPEPKFASAGYIIVRWTENADLPIPPRQKCGGARGRQDETILSVLSSAEAFYFLIFLFLRSKAPAGIRWEIDDPEPWTPEAAAIGEDALSWYFEKYNPHYDRAATELSKGMGIPGKNANLAMRKIFIKKQLEMYESNPQLVDQYLSILIGDELKKSYSSIF